MESQPNFCLIWIPKDTKYVLKYKKVKYFEIHLGNKSEVNEQIQHCAPTTLLNSVVSLLCREWKIDMIMDEKFSELCFKTPFFCN